MKSLRLRPVRLGNFEDRLIYVPAAFVSQLRRVNRDLDAYIGSTLRDYREALSTEGLTLDAAERRLGPYISQA